MPQTLIRQQTQISLASPPADAWTARCRGIVSCRPRPTDALPACARPPPWPEPRHSVSRTPSREPRRRRPGERSKTKSRRFRTKFRPNIIRSMQVGGDGIRTEGGCVSTLFDVYVLLPSSVKPGKVTLGVYLAARCPEVLLVEKHAATSTASFLLSAPGRASFGEL